MADYSSWLLVSDIDGTLNDKSRKIPKNNIEAIRDFVSKGGHFALCSGRNLASLTKQYHAIGIDTPAIFMNGAGLYDFKTEKMLYYVPLSDTVENEILNTVQSFKGFFKVELSVYSHDRVFSFGHQISGYAVSKLNSVERTVCLKEADLPRGMWGKANVFGLPKAVKKMKDHFESPEMAEKCNCFLTSPCTLEIVAKENNKGNGVLKLAEILGVENGNIAAIGDYYNDMDMLKAVKHPCCCGQAPQDIKDLSEYVACHCNQGAVADFIHYIEKKYLK